MSNNKSLSLFGLAMINVIAIDSLRTLPITAEYGFASVFYYLLAAIVFFLPSALVAAELATGWPETGGVYIWVREAFGKPIGLLVIWLQWFYNICWYPTIMSLIAATIAYTFNPALVQSKAYMLAVIMIVFWGATIVNCLGMRASSWLSNVAAIIGTLFPMVFIAALGIVWVALGKPISEPVTIRHFFPAISHVNNLVLLTAVLYGLVGMEMSASHAREVKNPQHNYPKAMAWSVGLILLTLIGSTLAIVIVVPQSQLDIVSGLLEAFEIFFKAFHMSWVMPILATMIVLGAIGSAAAWMLGPSKGLMMASRDGSLPYWLHKSKKDHSPIAVLLTQGVIFTLLCTVFLLMPSVSSGYWALTDIASILALFVYLLMFSAALCLRYKFPDVKRSFTIPGGKIGLWICCLLGFTSSALAIAIGFLPPSQIPVGNSFRYEMILAIGVFLGLVVPFLLYGGVKLLRQ